MRTILYTSLAEIRSFKPCAKGWKALLSAHPHSTEEEMNALFPLIDCIDSNSVSNVCWLLNKKKAEVQIAVKFARLCAESVAYLKNAYAANAAYAAAAYAAYAAAYANADAAYANAAYAAYAANAAAADAAYANAYADAYNKQKEVNKSFLRQVIIAYQNGEL